MIHRHDPQAPPGLQDEFWGEQADWTSSDLRPITPSAGLGAMIGRWWSGLLGAGSGVERVHGRPSGTAMPQTAKQSDDENYDDHDDDYDDDERTGPFGDDRGPFGERGDAWSVEPEPPQRGAGVDPLLARFGGLAVVLTLATPVVMGFTSGSAEDPSVVDSAAELAAVADQPVIPPVSTTLTVEADAQAVVEPAGAATGPATGAPSVDTARDRADEPVLAAALEDDDAPVAAAPITEPPCGDDYELAAGDYWIRIADAADVDLVDLLAVNDASVDSVLVPGASICLPVGASTPAPPPSTAPRTATPTSSPAASNTSPSVSTATVPAAPTTTVPPRPAAFPAAESVAVIRSVWPDDLEERAVEIAWRESNHRSNVNNWCCYGLFQIHWEAHRSWLSSIGVTSAPQLYDPRLNAVAAYTLYQRAGGFGPWGG